MRRLMFKNQDSRRAREEPNSNCAAIPAMFYSHGRRGLKAAKSHKSSLSIQE